MAKDLKEQIEIMTHYLNGGEVELKRKNENDTKWRTSFPCWDWTDYEYRIKEPKQKIIIQKWLCKSNFGGFVILECSNINMVEGFTKVKLIKSYEVEL